MKQIINRYTLIDGTTIDHIMPDPDNKNVKLIELAVTATPITFTGYRNTMNVTTLYMTLREAIGKGLVNNESKPQIQRQTTDDFITEYLQDLGVVFNND